MAAINICKPGVPYSAIGGVIEDYVTAHGLSTTRNYCGLHLPLSALSLLSLLCQQSAAYVCTYICIMIIIIIAIVIAIVIIIIIVCVCVCACVCIYACACGWVGV